MPAEHVLHEMADCGRRRLHRLGASRILVLAVLGGGFITVGALFSLLLGDDIGSPGLVRLMEGLGFLGNFLGALLIGGLIAIAHDPPTGCWSCSARSSPAGCPSRRSAGPDRGGAWSCPGSWRTGWSGWRLSFATMGRTILGKYVPVALAVTFFVAANFQHSPANMGYFSLLMFETEGPGWTAAFAWNLIPAGIGNLLGGTLLVALPFWYAFQRFLTGDDR